MHAIDAPPAPAPSLTNPSLNSEYVKFLAQVVV